MQIILTQMAPLVDWPSAPKEPKKGFQVVSTQARPNWFTCRCLHLVAWMALAACRVWHWIILCCSPVQTVVDMCQQSTIILIENLVCQRDHGTRTSILKRSWHTLNRLDGG